MDLSGRGSVGRHRHLIARVRDLCVRDPGLPAALMYGSFADPDPAAADEHSDIEFWLFFTAPPPDPGAWIAAVEPPLHVLRNESGTHVAIFPGLIRGEFHLATTADLDQVRGWPAGTPVIALKGHIPTPAGVLDLTTDVCGPFANWLLLAWHVGNRGEILRQRDALSHAQRHLLRMARLATGRTAHWQTPSRRAETDLDEATLAGFARTHQDVTAMWQLGRALWQQLDPHPPEALFAELDRALGPPAR